MKGKLSSVDLSQPLAYASIFSENGKGSYSDQDGNYDIKITAYKNELVRISYIGYEERFMMIQEMEDLGQIELKIDDHIFTESIVITGYVKKGICEGSSFNSLDLSNRASFSDAEVIDQDIFREIQRLPGISSPDESATNLNIRGSSFDHNLISWEGVTLYDRGHLFGMISSVNPFSLSRTRVYKGSHSASIDNRIGGVVELFLFDRVPDKTQVSAGASLTEGHLNVNVPIIKDKLSFFIAGRKSISKLLDDSPTFDSYGKKLFESRYIQTEIEDEEEEDSGESEFDLDFYDINAKIIFSPSGKMNFQSSFFRSRNMFDSGSKFLFNGFQTSESSENISTALINKLTFEHAEGVSSELTQSVSSYSSRNNYNFINLEDELDQLILDQKNSVQDIQVKLSHSRTIKNSDLKVGLILDRKSSEIEVFEDSRYSSRLEEEEEVGTYFYHLYSDYSLRLDRTVLQFGVRNSYSSYYGNLNFSPRMNLRYMLNKDIHAKMSLGFYNQYIRQLHDFNGVDLSLSDNLWILHPERDADLLKSKKGSIGIIYEKNEWMVDVETYLNHNTGVSSKNPNVQNALLFDDNGETTSAGVDFIVNRTVKNFQNSIFYSFSKSTASFQMDDDEDFFRSNIDQTHILSLSNNYRFKNFDINLSYKYKTGLPYSDPAVLESDDDEEEEEQYEFELEDINTTRLKDYHRLDLGLQYKKSFNNAHLEIGASLLNILNAKNISSRKFHLSNLNEDDEDPELIKVEKLQLPRTLVAQIRVKF